MDCLSATRTALVPPPETSFFLYTSSKPLYLVHVYMCTYSASCVFCGVVVLREKNTWINLIRRIYMVLDTHTLKAIRVPYYFLKKGRKETACVFVYNLGMSFVVSLL